MIVSNLERFIVYIALTLFLTCVTMGYYLYSIGNFIPSYIIALISFAALLNIFTSYKKVGVNFNAYLMLSSGTSFALIVYISGLPDYIGTVWLMHSILFSYYFLGYEKGMSWTLYYLGILIVAHILFLIYPSFAPYPWPFMLANLASLSVVALGMILSAKNTQSIAKERDAKTKELENALKTVHKSQKKLIESEKMSSLGKLVAGVAHEINTPVGLSLTGATFIEDETNKLALALKEGTLGKNALDEYLVDVGKVSSSMHVSLRNAAQLVRSFKQVAIDQHTEEKRTFNLKEYVDEVLLSLHSKLKHEDVLVINTMQNDIEITSYAGIYSQALTNFINNSLLHAFESVEGATIIINGSIIDGYLNFTYRDNGIGVDEKTLLQMFDPFFTTKLGQGGSGLGLNIVYNLVVNKLNGEILTDSKVGKGLKINIKIPMNELRGNI